MRNTQYIRRRNHYCQIVANIFKYNIKHISLHKENNIVRFIIMFINILRDNVILSNHVES